MDSPIYIAFRNEDLSALSDYDHEMRVLDLFERHGMAQTLGVIPAVAEGRKSKEPSPLHPLSPRSALCRALAAMASDGLVEIALHGMTHQTNRFSMPSRREYDEFSGLPLGEQEDRIREGKAILLEALGLTPRIFIPPWNRMDRNTVLACDAAGLDRLSAGIYTPPSGTGGSLGVCCTLQSLPYFLEQARSRPGPVYLRVLFHSANLRDPAELARLKGTVDAVAADPECRVVPLGEMMGRWASDARVVNEAGRNVDPRADRFTPARLASLVHQRALPFLPANRLLSRSFRAADGQYRAGRYREASRMGEEQDRLCGKVLLQGRCFTALVAAAAGAVASAGSPAPAGWGAAALLLALVALPLLVATWLATSRETRRELATLAAIASTSALSALLLAAFLRLPR
jgi:peptidoglycan/xylan/chitin deacetylase (PgdA/CDA1 family)